MPRGCFLIGCALGVLVPGGCQRAEPPSAQKPWIPATPTKAVPTEVTAKAVRFSASDGHAVFGDLYTGRSGARTVALLFHQAGSNAGEYEPLAPFLCERGLDCLAVDQRSGGTRWNRDNRTVKASGGSSAYAAAYADLEGALKWARSQGKYARVVAMGSSYSASLVFRLATEHEGVAAVFAFSPGEYLTEKGAVSRWAKSWRGPVFVACSPEEANGDAKRIFDASAGENASPTRFAWHPGGAHGASTFRDDACPAAKEYRQDLADFLRSLRPSRTTVNAITEPTTE